MSVRAMSYLLVAMLLVPVAGRAQEELPVPVFVTQLETTPLPPLKPEEHEAESRRTRSEMLDVAEQLRKQHGEKTSAWPPEVWKVFYDAEDAHTLAVARRDYQPSNTRLGLADSVEDFLRGAGGSKAMRMVTNADQAALVVQITGRRRISRSDVLDNGYFIRFRLAPGAMMTNARFLERTHGYKWNGVFSKLISRAKDGSGYVDLEAGSPASYKNCASSVRAIVEIFIGTQLDPAKKKR